MMGCESLTARRRPKTAGRASEPCNAICAAAILPLSNSNLFQIPVGAN